MEGPTATAKGGAKGVLDRFDGEVGHVVRRRRSKKREAGYEKRLVRKRRSKKRKADYQKRESDKETDRDRDKQTERSTKKQTERQMKADRG